MLQIDNNVCSVRGAPHKAPGWAPRQQCVEVVYDQFGAGEEIRTLDPNLGKVHWKDQVIENKVVLEGVT